MQWQEKNMCIWQFITHAFTFLHLGIMPPGFTDLLLHNYICSVYHGNRHLLYGTFKKWDEDCPLPPGIVCATVHIKIHKNGFCSEWATRRCEVKWWSCTSYCLSGWSGQGSCLSRSGAISISTRHTEHPSVFLNQVTLILRRNEKGNQCLSEKARRSSLEFSPYECKRKPSSRKDGQRERLRFYHATQTMVSHHFVDSCQVLQLPGPSKTVQQHAH